MWGLLYQNERLLLATYTASRVWILLMRKEWLKGPGVSGQMVCEESTQHTLLLAMGRISVESHHHAS